VIDPRIEQLLPFAQAVEHVPRRRRGKKLHVGTLYRWARDGVAGVRLEIVYVGSSPMTTVEALHRFFAAVARAKCPQPSAPPIVAPRKPVRAARFDRELQVERELDRILGPAEPD
jgi:Protein of unknown function (DUF1580)